MKYFSSFAFAAAGLLLSACSNEDIMGVEQAPSPSEEILNGICATLPQSPFETTRMNHTADVEGINSVWQLGDTLGIYPIGGTQVDFPISDGAGTSRALFDGGSWALRSSYNYAAYYPYKRSNVFVKETEIAFDYTGQAQDGNGSMAHLGDYDFLAAGATTPDRNGTVDLMLNHLGCFVRIDLTFARSITPKKISIASNNAQFITEANVDLSVTTPALSPISTSPSVDLDLRNIPVDAGDVVTLYMMMAPVDLSESELTFTIVDNKGPFWTQTLSQGKNMEAGNAYCYSLDYSYDPFNGHDYVDLGLKDAEGHTIYWATCNVGASSPEEYGDFFAWGETEPYYTEGHSLDDYCSNWRPGKTGYDWQSYKWCNGSGETMTKYCTDSRYGSVDNKTVLDTEDDAASLNWGGSWRIPSVAELEQLSNNCNWSWIWNSVTGKYGYKVSNKSDASKFIYLPSGNCRSGVRCTLWGDYGYYWSSSIDSIHADQAWYFYTDNTTPGKIYSSHKRCDGLSVRAVCVYEE